MCRIVSYCIVSYHIVSCSIVECLLTDEMELLSRSSLLEKEEVSMNALLMISREIGILFWMDKSNHSYSTVLARRGRGEDEDEDESEREEKLGSDRGREIELNDIKG